MTNLEFLCDFCGQRFSERRNGEITIANHGSKERGVYQEVCEVCVLKVEEKISELKK